MNLMGAYQGEEGDRHRWHYTHTTLHDTLMNVAPWQAVHSFDWRVVPGMDLARDWWIMGMEAVK